MSDEFIPTQSFIRLDLIGNSIRIFCLFNKAQSKDVNKLDWDVLTHLPRTCYSSSESLHHDEEQR
jgi:hypothetical protein